MNKNKIEKYLITKYMGGSANMPPAQNIKYELEDGYKFAYRKVFGKNSITIIGIKKILIR